MARTRCVMMQRDETVLLEAWLRHHAHLFGFPNLTVFDGGSTDPVTAELLSRAQRAGADVRLGCEAGPDLERRQVHLKDLLTSWRAEGSSFDFAIPLECGEFVAVYTPDGVSCRRDRVHAALDASLGERLALTSGPVLAAAGDVAGEFRVSADRIGIFPVETLSRLDRSVPTMSLRFEARRRDTPVTCLRFGQGPVEDGLRVLFQGLGNVLDALGVQSARLGSPVPTPRGAPDDAVWVRPPDGGPTVRFRASAYGRANEDVGSSEWLAFLHYAALGAGE